MRVTLAVLAGCLASLCTGCSTPVEGARPDAAFPELRLFGTEHCLQAGKLKSGEIERWSFVFANPRPESIKIRAIETSCPCLIVNLTSSDFGANEKVTGEVIVDTNQELEFTGSMLLEAKGRTANGEIAFIIRVEVEIGPTVERVGSDD